LQRTAIIDFILHQFERRDYGLGAIRDGYLARQIETGNSAASKLSSELSDRIAGGLVMSGTRSVFLGSDV